LSPKRVYKSPPGPSGRSYSRRANYIAGVIQLVLAVVVVVAPFATNVSTGLRVLGILLGVVLAWFGTVLIQQGRAESRTMSNTLSPAPNITPRRWKTALYLRLLYGIAFAVFAGIGAAKHSVWLLILSGLASALNFGYFAVVLRHRPDRQEPG